MIPKHLNKDKPYTHNNCFDYVADVYLHDEPSYPFNRVVISCCKHDDTVMHANFYHGLENSKLMFSRTIKQVHGMWHDIDEGGNYPTFRTHQSTFMN